MLRTVCLISSIVGLLLIYIAAINIQPKEVALSEINFEMIGHSVVTTGYISYVKHSKGHIFLTLSDGSTSLQVPLFAGFVNAMKADGINPKFRRGDVIKISGFVSEYRGQLQIIPRKTSDIEVKGD